MTVYLKERGDNDEVLSLILNALMLRLGADDECKLVVRKFTVIQFMEVWSSLKNSLISGWMGLDILLLFAYGEHTWKEDGKRKRGLLTEFCQLTS